MKTIRSFTILLGLFLVLFTVGVTRAGAQNMEKTSFGGTFTLPLDTQWGPMTLSAGDYNLYYGQIFEAGAYAVQIIGKTNKNLHGWILAESPNTTSAKKNALICVRDGTTLVVRRLELPGIGKSVGFVPPRGARLVANQRNRNAHTQVAEVAVLIQRIPVKPSGK